MMKCILHFVFLLDFGDNEIEALCDHFREVLSSANVVVQNIPDQWTFLKAQLYQEVKFESLTWMEVNRWHRHACPDGLSLFDLLLSIPASAAECERGFSTMKQVKIQTVILCI